MAGLAVVGFVLLWPGRGAAVLAATAGDLAAAGGMLLSATLLGAGIVRWLGAGGLPRPLAMLVALALGVGAISVALLGLGAAGLIGHRWVFWAVFGVSAAAGAWPAWRLWRYSAPLPAGRAVSPRWAWAGLVLAPAGLVVLAGANLPPGVLWRGNVPGPVAGAQRYVDLEGRGYDALEYHLQVPREYLDGGRVRFLAHNVYSAFPQNAEMWFMAAMALVGRPQGAVYLVQWLNVLLAAAAVGAIYVAGRLGGRPAAGGGTLAAIAAAATPMLAAVAVVAYVEPMMLLFMAVAWALIRHYQLTADGVGEAPGEPDPPGRPGSKRSSPAGDRSSPAGDRSSPGRRLPARDAPLPAITRRTEHLLAAPDAPLATYAVIVGLLLGLAAGTKYLAIPLFIGPLAVGLLLARGLTRLPPDRKVRHAMLVATGLLLALAPWLVRNAAQTGGNPISPLLWSVFDGDYWTAADALRWNRAHLPDLPVDTRLAAAFWRFASHPSLTLLTGASARGAIDGSSLYGPWLWLLAWPIFLARSRSRWDWLLLATAAGQLGFWVFVTAVPGRFILPIVLPLALLAGRSMAAARPAVRGAMLIVLLSFAALSGLQLFDRFRACTTFPADQPGQPPVWAAGPLLRPGQDVIDQIDDAAAIVNGVLDEAGRAGLAPDRHPILRLVGDARPFYIRYPVDYTVVFSHDLLADALDRRPPAVVRGWLREAGLRYLFVDWAEIRRLRGRPDRPGYGFPDSINQSSLAALGRVSPIARPGRPPYWLIDLAEPPAGPAPATGAEGLEESVRDTL